MEAGRSEYQGHTIEVRTGASQRAELFRAGGEPEELLIDDESVPFGRLPDGSYYLEEYAYDWKDDLVDLARDLIDYRQRVQHGGPARGGEL